MTRTAVFCLLLAGCAAQQAPAPPPMPEDLSAWVAPAIVSDPTTAPTPPTPPVPAPRPAAANEVVYAYQEGKDYAVTVALGWPADVVFEPGETVYNIVGGDRAPLQDGEAPRWEMKEGRSDAHQTAVPHIFFTASHVGHTMGVVVTTNRRTYYLTVRSVTKTPTRAVRWTYPAPSTPPPPPVVAPRSPFWPEASHPQRYHVGYAIDGGAIPPDWTSTHVLDDGRKTYVFFPPTMTFQVAPLLRLIGPQGPHLVNLRQIGTVYVIDQLFGKAELRVGADDHPQLVTITRGVLHTIACPGHDLCPTWPMTGQPHGRLTP